MCPSLRVLAALFVAQFVLAQLPQPKSVDHEAKGVFLKYPSSYVNLTSESWTTKGDINKFIIAVNFQSRSRLGQIFNVRFISANGTIKGMLKFAIIDGHLDIDFLNSDSHSILNRPINRPRIHTSEQHLALGVSIQNKSLWYRVGTIDQSAEINTPIELTDCEISLTLGGGAQSMIGCVSLIAVSINDGSFLPGDAHHVASNDIEECPQLDECANRDCNKGKCKLLEVPVCDCYMTNMTGPNCRKPGSSVKLRNDDDNEEAQSFIRFNPFEPDQPIHRITMDFKFGDPENKEGVLVFASTTEDKILKVYAVNSHGSVVFDAKTVIGFELDSSTDRFHSLILRLNESHISLYIDDRIYHHQHVDGAQFSFKSIQFGAPMDMGQVADIGITGCLRNVYVDHFDVIDLRYSNDPRIEATRVRPCISDEHDESFMGAEMFSPDPLVPLMEESSEDVEDIDDDLEPDILGANIFPAPAKGFPKESRASGVCDKSQSYMCQHEAKCKKTGNTTFECVCAHGYIGKYCQFTTFPRSCSHARQFQQLPDGPTKIDVDGNAHLEPSVALCVDGVTIVPHDMKPSTEVRDSGFPHHSMFVVAYRDFNRQQLSGLINASGSCRQSISYRCNKAPLRFTHRRTWFSSVNKQNITQLGSVENACACIDTGCTVGEKCNCDGNSIAEDTGVMMNSLAGITEVFALFNPHDVHAEMTLGELKCSGYDNDDKPIRFSRLTELVLAEWSGESFELQFRTIDASGIIAGIRGHNDEQLIRVSLIDGHTIEIRHLEATKTIESQHKLNDSQWHHLMVDLADGEIRVTIDSTHHLLSIESTVVLDGFLVLADNERGFIGCVRSLRLNGDPVNLHDFIVDKESPIKPTCASRCSTNNHFCQNGAMCLDDFATETSFCECAFPQIHKGDSCEIDMNQNTSVSFHGAHLRQDNSSGYALTGTVHLSFRTDQSEALLFYAHDENNNFLQIHLSDEVNVTLTLNNIDIVSKCTVRATRGTEFSDMRWIQVSVRHSVDSSQLHVDDSACSIRQKRTLSSIPIQRFLNTANSDIVRLPVGVTAPLNPEPYVVVFIANVDGDAKMVKEESMVLSPRYYSPIRGLLGCMRGLTIGDQLVDMRKMVESIEDRASIRIGCDVGCSALTCMNGGHCSVGWTNFDPTESKTTCDCSRTSYAGASCTLDDGIRIESSGYLQFMIGAELSRIIFDHSHVPQIVRFAFSTDDKFSGNRSKLIALIEFRDGELSVQLNRNGTIDVAINTKQYQQVLNFDGNFNDGYRHLFVAQLNVQSATAVLIDSYRRDFAYQRRNLDMFDANMVQVGGQLPETSEDGYKGCISNLLIDFQRGSSLSFTPIAYLDNTGSDLHRLVHSANVTRSGCAPFRIPNELPVHRNRVEFPAWDTAFRRLIYHGETVVPTPGWSSDDSSSILWILSIIAFLLLLSLIIYSIFIKCCRERIHHRSMPPSNRSSELMPLKPFRTLPPSPPQKRRAAPSDYHLPDPNVDFNQEVLGDVDEDDDDTILVSHLSGSEDSQSTSATIRHIDDDDKEMVIVSRPISVNRIPRRLSSFRNTDPTAPASSPLHSTPSSPQPVRVNIPVPPPRTTSN